MLILQKEMLISTVSCKRNARNPKAREKSLEAVGSAERAGVSPDFAVFLSVSLYPDCVCLPYFGIGYGREGLGTRGNVLASPGVSLSVDGAGGGGALEFADVEAGGVGHGCGGGLRKGGWFVMCWRI